MDNAPKMNMYAYTLMKEYQKVVAGMKSEATGKHMTDKREGIQRRGQLRPKFHACERLMSFLHTYFYVCVCVLS